MGKYHPDPFTVDALELILVLDRFVTRNYGERCKTYEFGCVTCEMWKLRDEMVTIINPEE